MKNVAYPSVTTKHDIRCGRLYVHICHEGAKFKHISTTSGAKTGSCMNNIMSKMLYYMSNSIKFGDINKVIMHLECDGQQCNDGLDADKMSCTQAIADALKGWKNGNSGKQD